jgi:hypothetical protein
VEGPQVGDHAPVVELGGPLHPPGNVLSASVAASDVRLQRLQRKEIPQWSGNWGHGALSHSGILWIRARATTYTPGRRDVMNTLWPRRLWM